MVYRGPQLVQLVKGYPKRRFLGSPESRQHSSQVAISGDTSTNAAASALLCRITKSASPSGSSLATLTSLINASGGGRCRNVSKNFWMPSSAPSISTVTPADELK